MLLQFIIENYKSFKEKTVFNMASTAYTELPHHIINSKEGKEVKALRAAAFYGANASGKTNLIKAIAFAQRLIVDGTYGEQTINADPFLLDEKCKEEPTRIEFIFKYQKTIYHYGFLVNEDRIVEEWLFATPKNSEIRYFERKTLENDALEIKVGKGLAYDSRSGERIDLIAETCRPNQLFLKELFEKNNKRIIPVFKWFSSVLTIIPAVTEYGPLELRAKSDDDLVSFMSEFLKDADTGINAITTEQQPLDFDEHFPDMPDKLIEEMRSTVKRGGGFTFHHRGQKYTLSKDKNGQIILLKLKTSHLMSDGKEAVFDMQQESEGTQRLIHLLPAIADMVQSENVYIIDELDRRMHTLLTKMILETFLDTEDNSSQLVFSTHDTNLLDMDILRRDEIWFIKKDENGTSELYPLSDFKVRKDLRLENGYLVGRFGAIPFTHKSSFIEKMIN